MKPHKLADLLPPMSDTEYQALKADIQANGLNEDIWTHQGQILDGRHRHRACTELGVKPRFREYRGKTPAAFVLGQNKRRNLTPSQWAMVAAEIEPLIAKEEGIAAKREGGKKAGRGRPIEKDVANRPQANGRAPTSREKAAATVGTSGRQTQRAKAIKQQAPDVAAEVLAGKLNLHQAQREVKRRQKTAELEAKAKIANRKAKGSACKILCGDCLELLPTVGHPRLIFADPPYNIGVDYGQGAKADKLPANDYLLWCGHWIGACRDILTDDGSLWVMINDEWADHFGLLLRAAGFHRRAWIKWHETFGVNCHNNFNRTTRHVFYCVANTKRFVFNPSAVSRPSDRQAKYGDKRAAPHGKILDDLWQIPRLADNHPERMPFFPTQIPAEVLRRIVGCASDPGDLVADPFSGSGTTAVVCKELGRRFVGIERNQDYADRSLVRVLATET